MNRLTQTYTKTCSPSSQTVTLSSATDAQGTLSYSIVSQKNSSNTPVSYFSLSGTTLTLAANAPVGTYMVEVKASAEGDDNYNSGSKDYEYMVVAYKNVGDRKMTLAASVVVHATTKGAKFTIAKSVKVKPTSVTLEIGQTVKLKASEVKAEKGKKIKRHRPVKYESDNLFVATVADDSAITAVGEGSTIVYVYAQNGLYKAVTVTVTPGQVVPNSVEEPETEADALETDSLTEPDVVGEEIVLDDVIVEDANDSAEIEAEIILEDNKE